MGSMGMMMMLKVMGMVAFIFTTLLLAVSFFILVAVRKTEEQWLKVFGYVTAILLWISAAIVFSAVISAATAGCNLRAPMMQGMHGMKGSKQPIMHGQQPMTQGHNQGQPMTQEKAVQNPGQ